MSKELKSCPLCGKEVTVHGPEDWKPTFYDPDSGGDPYSFCCECGMEFHSHSYEYEEAVDKFNTRKPLDNIIEQLEWYLTGWVPIETIYKVIEIVQGGEK